MGGQQPGVLNPSSNLTTTYQWDSLHRLTAVTRTGALAGGTTRYGYDLAGRQTSITCPTGAIDSNRQFTAKES